MFHNIGMCKHLSTTVQKWRSKDNLKWGPQLPPCLRQVLCLMLCCPSVGILGLQTHTTVPGFTQVLGI